MGSNGCSFWPVIAVVSTTNSCPQRSQPPFRTTHFGQLNGACAHYVMVSKFQWNPFWLATQRDPQNDWTATQKSCELWCICTGPINRSVCLRKTSSVLYVLWATYLPGVLPRLQRTSVIPGGFACMGTISQVIVKTTTSTLRSNISSESANLNSALWHPFKCIFSSITVLTVELRNFANILPDADLLKSTKWIVSLVLKGFSKFSFMINAMASIHHYFACEQVGDTQERGKPEMRSSCRNSLDLHWSASTRPSRGCASVPHLRYLSVSRHFNE